MSTENNQKCRWFEGQFFGEEDGKQKDTHMKFLVREKDFEGDAEPIKILRGWIKEADNDAIAIDSGGDKAEAEV